MPATAPSQGLGTLCSPVYHHSTKSWERSQGRVRGSQATSYLLLFHFDLRGHGDVGAADGKEEAFNMERDTGRVVQVGRLRSPETIHLLAAIAPERHQGVILAGLRILFYG